MAMKLRDYRDNALISSFLAGRSVRSLAAEYGLSELAVRRAIGRDEYARAELKRGLGQ
ncbi:MAG: hypothetical protein ACREE3_17275 [Stellaceae bacterium]